MVRLAESQKLLRNLFTWIMVEKSLLLIGPEPPPATGMELATEALAVELRRSGLAHLRLNTADPEDELGNRGNWTTHNVRLAVRHLLEACRKSFRSEVGAIYLPIAQEFPGLIRDVGFLLVAGAARKPVIVHLHGGAFAAFYESQSRLSRWLLRATVGRATLGIVLTDHLRPSLECVLPPDRVVVIPNGIDLEVRDNSAVADGEVVVLFLSALYRWKGTLVFIEAFARARSACPFLRATMAGEWASAATRDEALALTERLGIADYLTFTGGVGQPEKSRLYGAASIFCFPSLITEGQPLVILEAMAAGLPVVATGWPGIADTIVDGETGLLVEHPTPDAFADALIRLADGPEERRRLGTAARARYELLYTQNAFGDRMTQVLRPLVERTPKMRKPEIQKEAS